MKFDPVLPLSGFGWVSGYVWRFLAGVVLKHYSRVLASGYAGLYGEFGGADSGFLFVFGNFWANLRFRKFEKLSEKPILLKNGLKNPLFGQNQLRINR